MLKKNEEIYEVAALNCGFWNGSFRSAPASVSARSLSSSCLLQGAFRMFIFANNQSREGVTASVLSSLPREGWE